MKERERIDRWARRLLAATEMIESVLEEMAPTEPCKHERTEPIGFGEDGPRRCLDCGDEIEADQVPGDG